MPEENASLVPASVPGALLKPDAAAMFLGRIRPAWRARRLIERVRSLIPVDPSSACQRLFNAAVQDLREKVVAAGLDIATEAASAFRLPTVGRAEDVQEYSVANLIDLAYRVGILSRPQWRRIKRCYDIRRDLEHEDSEYEATAGDVVYIFTACVEDVLQNDPVEVLRVKDVQDLIEQPVQAAPSLEVLTDYKAAPAVRQREIVERLVVVALDARKPDIVRQNSVETLRRFEPFTGHAVKVEAAEALQDRLGRAPIDLATAKVAAAAGLLPYLKQRKLSDLFSGIAERLETAGHGWRNHALHAEPLEQIEDLGGLVACPVDVRPRILRWMVLCYLGERGGYGSFGSNRRVFFSDIAASRIERLVEAARGAVGASLEELAASKDVEAAVGGNKDLARRLEQLREFGVPPTA